MQTINDRITDAIIEGITESMDENEGVIDFEVEVDENTIVEVKGWYEQDGYCEDDYYNGTGGWITTKSYVCIDDYKVYTFDSEGGEVENDIKIDTDEIEKQFAA